MEYNGVMINGKPITHDGKFLIKEVKGKSGKLPGHFAAEEILWY